MHGDAETRLERFCRGLLRNVLGLAPRVEPYTAVGTPTRVRVMARVILSRPWKSRLDSSAQRQRGFRSYIAASAPGVHLRISVAGLTHDVVSDRYGYVDSIVEVDPARGLKPGWQHISIAAMGPDIDHRSPAVNAAALIVGPETTWGIVSDIDDTAMVTSVPHLPTAIWNTLWVRGMSRRAVRGMAQLYRDIAQAQPGIVFIYLSAGAWNTARTLRRFLARHQFPAGPLLLTSFSPRWLRWYRGGPAHKAAQLDWLMDTFTSIRWVLIGDDGQKDPQIYADATQKHPGRVAAIVLRGIRKPTQAATDKPGVPPATDVHLATDTDDVLPAYSPEPVYAPTPDDVTEPVDAARADVPVIIGQDGAALKAGLIYGLGWLRDSHNALAGSGRGLATAPHGIPRVQPSDQDKPTP